LLGQRKAAHIAGDFAQVAQEREWIEQRAQAGLRQVGRCPQYLLIANGHIHSIGRFTDGNGKSIFDTIMPISCPDLHKRPVALAEPLRGKAALVKLRQQHIRDFVRAEIAVKSSLFHRFLRCRNYTTDAKLAALAPILKSKVRHASRRNPIVFS
jgi:hypothetical protein